MLLSDLSKRAEFVNTGIYRQHVDVPGLCLDVRKDAVEVGEVRGIALDRRGIAADRGDCLIQFGLTAAGNKHPRAFFGETFGDRKADPGAAPVTRAILPASLPVMVTSFQMRLCHCSSADGSAVGSSS